MIAFEIEPLVGVGPIKFGATKLELASILGAPQSIHENRHKYLSGLFVNFDSADKIEFIELSQSNEFVATFKGINLLAVKADDTLAHVCKFDSFDKNDPEIGYSYIFKNVQLCLWRSTIPESKEDNGQYFQAVGVGANGYYQ